MLTVERLPGEMQTKIKMPLHNVKIKTGWKNHAPKMLNLLKCDIYKKSLILSLIPNSWNKDAQGFQIQKHTLNGIVGQFNHHHQVLMRLTNHFFLKNSTLNMNVQTQETGAVTETQCISHICLNKARCAAKNK